MVPIIQWVIIHYFFFFYFVQIAPHLASRSPFKWLHVLLARLNNFFLSTSLISGTIRYFGPILYLPYFSPGIGCFYKNLIPFNVEWYVVSKIWHQVCSLLLRCHCFLALQQTEHTNTHTYILEIISSYRSLQSQSNPRGFLLGFVCSRYLSAFFHIEIPGF